MHISIKEIHCSFTPGISGCPQYAKPLSSPASSSLFSTVHMLIFHTLMAVFSLHIYQYMSLLRIGQKFCLTCVWDSCLSSLPVPIPDCSHFPSHLQRRYAFSTVAITQALLSFSTVRAEMEIIAPYQYLSYFSSPLTVHLSQEIIFSLPWFSMRPSDHHVNISVFTVFLHNYNAYLLPDTSLSLNMWYFLFSIQAAIGSISE